MEAYRISISLHPSAIFISDEAKSLQGYYLVFSFLSVEKKKIFLLENMNMSLKNAK